MDIFTHLFVVKIVICVWKDEYKKKEVGVGPFKKTWLLSIVMN